MAAKKSSGKGGGAAAKSDGGKGGSKHDKVAEDVLGADLIILLSGSGKPSPRNGRAGEGDQVVFVNGTGKARKVHFQHSPFIDGGLTKQTITVPGKGTWSGVVANVDFTSYHYSVDKTTLGDTPDPPSIVVGGS